MANVKDPITPGLPAQGPSEGVEARGLGGCLAIQKLKVVESYVVEDEGTDGVEKTAFVPQKIEKGKLSMGPIVEFGWKSKDYSTLATETISLVG